VLESERSCESAGKGIPRTEGTEEAAAAAKGNVYSLSPSKEAEKLIAQEEQ